MPIKLSIVIPAKNEEQRIVGTMESIVRFFATHPMEYELIVVENNSTDNTADVARGFASRIPHLTVLQVGSTCGGKGGAVKRGVLESTGEFVLFMDADNATHIEEVEKFWPVIEQGADVVIGSRHVSGSDIREQQPLLRRLMGRFANLLIRVTILPGVRDTQCGFKLFRQSVARQVFAAQEIQGWGFDLEILAIARRWKYRIVEVPVNWYHVGESRLRPIKAALHTFGDLLRVMKNLMIGVYDRRRTTSGETGKNK